MRDLVPAAECGWETHMLTVRKLCVCRRRICNLAGGWCPGTASCTGMETSVGDIRPVFESGKVLLFSLLNVCLFILMFLAAMGFCCYMQAFLVAAMGLLFTVVCGLLCYTTAWVLGAPAQLLCSGFDLESNLCLPALAVRISKLLHHWEVP